MYGFKLIGPTHPDALDAYDFKLEGRRSQDGRVVYDIAVIPKTTMQPCFAGSLSVLDEEYALVSVDVTSRNIHPQEFYLQKLAFSCRQQFSRFDSLYWLPVDFHGVDQIRFGIPGLQFPGVTMTRISSLDHYRINSDLADSIFIAQSATAKPRQVSTDSLLAFSQRAVPLTMEEARAYRIIDSSLTVDKAFKPTGYLSRYVKVEAKPRTAADSSKLKPRWRNSWSPHLGFNRVDGGQFGLATTVSRAGLILSGFAQYYSAAQRWGKGAEVRLQPSCCTWFGQAGWRDQTAAKGSGSIYAQQMAAAATLLGRADYFDYYHNREWQAAIGQQIKKYHLSWSTGLAGARHRSLAKTTDFSIIRRSDSKRLNPAVADGRYNRLQLRVAWGDNENTLGTIGQSGWTFDLEQGLPSLGSEVSFSRAESRLRLRIPTFYRRYLFPNTLDLLLCGGISTGDLPVQSSFSLDGRLLVLAPFGAFKTIGERPRYGHRHAALFWEHNFRGAPLQWLGLTSLADKGIHLLLHGGAAKIWNRYGERQESLIHETGLGVNGLLTYLRCDVTVRWSEYRAVFITLAPRKLF